MADINAMLSFGAGFLSFVSPCCLPVYPAFLSYITGMSVQDLKSEQAMYQKQSLLHTFFFLLGFSIIFIALGFGTSLIGNFFISYQDLIRQIGAILIVFVGFVTMGILQPEFLMKERKVQFKQRPAGYAGSILIGLGFAAGWSPCIGPILTAVMGLAGSHPDSGMLYMISYVLGFSVPFFVLAFFIGKIQRITRYTRSFMKTGGVIMVGMGMLLFFDGLTVIIRYFTELTGFSGF
ncbi:cytochrome c biogenesis protein CcdA [Bacillus sp. FJAT-42376]|uniref:cytochrome c biogenesis CcdA family protein n=1 Tax=Bacillus sp. FJAT-42376 TaxID=2014076 RepID=UPI000F4D3B88|nr:cytochrome c biogenesis protein CcdA [Bacillus sp. FJAT-42376]AZB43052.1 cytochrome c biogenesis protein CcdA [Bacillus sp. FJAT-42376]